MALTPKQKLAWRMCRRQGRKQGEVAELLGTTRESVNRLVRRADERIQEMVKLCGGAECGLIDALVN